MAASGTLLVACASGQTAGTATPAYRPMLVDNYRAPPAAELYAQRFQVSVAQLSVDDARRFVLCREECPAATPKTPVATLNAAVLQRMRSSRRTEPPTDPAAHEYRQPQAEGGEVEALDGLNVPSPRAPINSADVASTD